MTPSLPVPMVSVVDPPPAACNRMMVEKSLRSTSIRNHAANEMPEDGTGGSLAL